MDKTSSVTGAGCAIVSYVMWGVLPVYWKLLSAINAVHILAARILLSLLAVGCALLACRNTAWLAAFRDKRNGPLLVLSALTISFNWGLYIWAVNQGRTIEASLGYYINPLVSIALGLVMFREKMRPLQWLAFAVALLGVLLLTVLSGVAPWVSLGLALSFGLYGAFKKTVTLSALEALGAETLAAAPLGLLLLFGGFGGTGTRPGLHGIAALANLPAATLGILALSGVITVFRLYLARGGDLRCFIETRFPKIRAWLTKEYS